MLNISILIFLGLYLYMLVVETFTAENIKLKVYTTIGWGELATDPYQIKACHRNNSSTISRYFDITYFMY